MSHYDLYAVIHRHPTIHRYDLYLHVSILDLCFDVRVENSKTALAIIWPVWYLV